MDRHSSHSSAKLTSKINLEKLPLLASPQIVIKEKQAPQTDRNAGTILSTPLIEKSTKKLQLMKKIKAVKSRTGHDSSSDDSIEILRRL